MIETREQFEAFRREMQTRKEAAAKTLAPDHGPGAAPTAPTGDEIAREVRKILGFPLPDNDGTSRN